MRHIFKHILTVMLVLSMLMCAVLPAYAEGEEEYLCDLRLIYADDYKEAKQILADTEFEDYTLLDENLNANTGKTGVWLAYQTTTDVEDAITDIAIMQMQGGYSEGNYQKMIDQSYNEYLDMGDNYMVAIDHFIKGYDAGHYLSTLAYRQLNFYTVITEGVDEIPDFEGELLGDIFYAGIDVSELATMFMEGNSYALANIRSLIAMGVSYNEDGMTYLEKVADEVEALEQDPNRYVNEDYTELAAIIAPTIATFRTMFKEFETVEPELNYEDEEVTESELKYLEYKAMAEMTRNVNYLDGKTFYEFCLAYELNNADYSSLYPLVAALNEGQVAMVRVAHYYDVVRYSMTVEEDETIEEELAALEERYCEKPFNIYTGVDRTIYEGSFALTSAASRADAYTESGLAASLYGEDYYYLNTAATVTGGIGVCLLTVGAGLHLYRYANMTNMNNAFSNYVGSLKENFGETIMSFADGTSGGTAAEQLDMLIDGYTREQLEHGGSGLLAGTGIEDMSFQEQYDFLEKFLDNTNPEHADLIGQFREYQNAYAQYESSKEPIITNLRDKAAAATEQYSASLSAIYTLYVVGGLMTLFSAIKLGYSIYHYYHPTYDDIPVAMVDMINTVDGDRYIKYDVVMEAEQQRDGKYIPGDLNAYQASRWNAMYYTKSYEAGKPLLADAFSVSTNNNVPDKNYAPVHRFGEVVSYNLNKYNFNDDHSIYLSVKQSENQKSAVQDVPELVGSMFSKGFLLLAGGIGMISGVGGVLGAQEFVKIRKSKKAEGDRSSADRAGS